MSAQEFILNPKQNCIKNQPKASEILDDPTIAAKSQQLTLLQRVPEKKSQIRKKRLKRRRPQRTGKISRKNYFAQSQCSILIKLKRSSPF